MPKIFNGIETTGLNPQIVDIALHWNGSLESFVSAYKAFEDALFPVKPEEPEAETMEPEPDTALVKKFFAEYRNGHDPDFGIGSDLLFAAFLDIADIYEEGKLLRTQAEFDALINRWRIVSKKVAFLEKKNVASVIDGLEKAEKELIKRVGNAGYDVSYGLTSAIEFLRRLA